MAVGGPWRVTEAPARVAGAAWGVLEVVGVAALSAGLLGALGAAAAVALVARWLAACRQVFLGGMGGAATLLKSRSQMFQPSGKF